MSYHGKILQLFGGNRFSNLYSNDMDGSNEYATVPDNSAFSFTNGAGQDLPFSIVISFKRNGAVTNNTLMAKFTSTGNNAEWLCRLISGSLQFAVYNNAGTALRGRSAPLSTTGSWVTIAITNSGNEATTGTKIYNITGGTVTQIDTADLSVGVYSGMTNGTSPLYLGAFNSGGIVQPFNGLIYHPQIWNIELTGGVGGQLAEIGANPHKDARTYSFGANCVSAWHYPNGTSDYPAWTDYVNAHNATMQNAESADINTDIP